MMNSFSILSLFFILSLKLNSECHCEKIDYYNNLFNCDTTFLDNGNFIFWQMNCDSAWFNLETPNGEKYNIIFCQGEFEMSLCRKLGLQFLKEYENYLLFCDRLISGCCTSPDVVFINKMNGNEIKRINSINFIWGDVEEDYIFYQDPNNELNFILLNHKNNNSKSINLSKSNFLEAGDSIKPLQLADLFSDFEIKNDSLHFIFAKGYKNYEKKYQITFP